MDLFTPAAFGQFGFPFLLVQGAFLIGALAQIVLTVRDLLLGRASASWVPVEDAIIESSTVRRVNRNAFRAKIAYTYTVGGRTYRGRRRAYRSEYAFQRSSAEAVAARYAAGTRVRAYHHPTRPSFAVLEPGVMLTGALARLGRAALSLAFIAPFFLLTTLPFWR